MDFSRSQFLKGAVVGLSVAAVPLLFNDRVYAGSPGLSKSQGPGSSARVIDVRTPYQQTTADQIHNNSVEQQIQDAGQEPVEVKAHVTRRLQSLITN